MNPADAEEYTQSLGQIVAARAEGDHPLLPAPRTVACPPLAVGPVDANHQRRDVAPGLSMGDLGRRTRTPGGPMTEHPAEVMQRPAGALAVRANQTDWTDDQKAALQAMGIDNTVTRGDLQVFLTYAQRTGLDPFARQIYLIKRAGKWGIQAGIDGLRVVAARSGKYQGQTAAQWCGDDGMWLDVWLRDDPPAAARAGVFHADYREPLYAVATWNQYVALTRDDKPTAMWAKMPALMLHKCAEALALRRAFPHDLSGMYIAEEMDQRGPAELARPVSQPSLPDLVDAARNAQSLAELQATWREAAAFGLLDEPLAVDAETAEVTETLRDLLMGLAGKLDPAPQEQP